jgi:hypothetical protein
MKTLAIVALSVAAAVLVGSTVYHGGDNLKAAGSDVKRTFGGAVDTVKHLGGVDVPQN